MRTMKNDTDAAAAPRRRFRLRGAMAAVAAMASLAAAAEWREVAKIQVASMDVMKPQLALLAAKAKFPLLPMLVPQVLSQVDMAGRFEPLSPGAEFGFKLVTDAAAGDSEIKIVAVWAWPLSKGVAAQWRAGNKTDLSEDGTPVWKTQMAAPDPANPQVPKKVDAYIAFTADDSWAYVGEAPAASAAAAKSGAPFVKPLKKGLLAISVDGEKSISAIAGMFKVSGAGVDIAGFNPIAGAGAGALQFLPEGLDTSDFKGVLPALLGELKSMRVVAGASKSGLDFRFTFEPRPGSALARPGVSMPRSALEFRGVPPNSIIGFAAVPFEKDGVLGKAWNSFMDKSAKKMAAHFAKFDKDDQYEDSLRAFMRFASAFVGVAEELRASPVKTSAVSFSLAEDDNGKKDVRMGAFCADPAGSYGLSNPGVKGLMPLKMEEAGGALSVTGTEKGFNGGGQTPAGAAFAAVFPENKQAKEPLFAGFHKFTVAGASQSASGHDDDSSAPANLKTFGVWAFGWRAKGSSVRAILRVPADDLETVASIFLHMSVSE